MEEVASPKVVFVTGPHAFKDGFVSFVFGDSSKADSTGFFIGMGAKKVRKTKPRNEFVKGGFGYGEMVEHPFDKSQNITRRRRIELLTGVKHWVDSNKEKVPGFGGPCRAIIAREATNSTVNER